MKADWLVWLLLFLMLGVADAQQTNSSRVVTNNVTIEELRAKAEKGDAEAQFELGTNFWTTDEHEAVKWFTKAAEQNYKRAFFYLGVHFGIEERPIYDAKKSFEFYLRGAKLGDAECAFFTGQAYIFGIGTTTNTEEGLRWVRKSADQGCGLAPETLACWYYYGRGIPKNLTNAIYWYEKAAEQGDESAQLKLGYIHETETKNYGEAAKWYRKAAELGNINAQFELGLCYDGGRGVTQDYAEAVKWYRKAAEAGEVGAQVDLGLLYYNLAQKAQNTNKSLATSFNFGIPYNRAELDYAEAIKWFHKAAEQGFAPAQFYIGTCYHFGNGVTKDEVEAVKWCRKAADQGYTDAQNTLGTMYQDGTGVPQDYVEAYKWFILAAAQGAESAAQNRDALFSFMTQEQIAEAQQLAREFTSRKESASNFTPPRPDEIITTQPVPTATGTGFFITDDGYLISNYHVVKDAMKVRFVTSTGTIAAKVVQVDAANDLALLKAYGRFAPLPIAASRPVRLGNTVATVGFPNTGLQGFSPKLAKGEIASLSGAADDPRYFQISVPVQPGNSGGALVDERGNVIGIVSAKLDASVALAASGALPENVNYAVKSSLLLSFLESVPDVSAKLKAPVTVDRKFEDVVKSAQEAAVLVLVY